MTRSRTRPMPVLFVCGGCGGLLVEPTFRTSPDIATALEAARLELPCECDGEDDELGESD